MHNNGNSWGVIHISIIPVHQKAGDCGNVVNATQYVTVHPLLWDGITVLNIQ